MCESKERSGLPLLPGFTFLDPTKSAFHKSHFLDISKGVESTKHYVPDCGSYPRDIDSVQYHNCDDDIIYYDPSLTYGRVREPQTPAFRPHFVTYDQKCLTFQAFFKIGIFDSPDEYFRVRHVKIIYFLDDDTLTVTEPRIDNAGFPQGRLIRRGKIPKYGHDGEATIHWKDLNIGIDLMMQGIVYHIVDCDLFTKEFLISMGVELNDPECLPPDPYIELRKAKGRLTVRKTPSAHDTLRRFLEFGGRVLRFRAVWDNGDSECGDLGSYCVKYYLDDDTVEVAEIHERNSGKDPFPLLLRRTRLPKDWTDTPVTWPSIYLERSDQETIEYYQPKDFMIGNTIFVFGRRMLLHKCDQETRRYFTKALNITQPPDFDVSEEPKKSPPVPPPPVELRIGALEDSLETCKRIIVRPPKRDELKLILNAGKYLRYSAKMRTTHTEDNVREFVIFYSLADSTIKIMELNVRNSGHVGGKFLSSMLVPKPGSQPDFPIYYSPTDFYIGAVIDIFGHKFEVVGADRQVYRYMEGNPEKFNQEAVDNMRAFMIQKGLIQKDGSAAAGSAMLPTTSPDADQTCEHQYEKQTIPDCPKNPDICTPDPEYQPKQKIPEDCPICPELEYNGRVSERCKLSQVPEMFLDELSGRMRFNIENPNWK